MTPSEAAAAIRDIDRMIDQCRGWQRSVDDVLMLVRIGVQLDNLRQEQRWLIGLLMAHPLPEV